MTDDTSRHDIRQTNVEQSEARERQAELERKYREQLRRMSCGGGWGD